MRRGPKPQADTIKALKGDRAAQRRLKALAQQPQEPTAPIMPDFVTHPMEQEIFRRVMASPAMRRLIGPDTVTLGRYCVYLRIWIGGKALLDAGEQSYELVKSKHGERRARGPAYATMTDCERHLVTLEDRLGLSPEARAGLMRDLPLPPPRPLPEEPEDESIPSPIGFGRLN